MLNAAKFLETRVGPSAVEPKADWKFVNTSGGPAANVTVSDEGASTEATFALHEISDYQFTKMRLYDLWFDLLDQRLSIHQERYRNLEANTVAE